MIGRKRKRLGDLLVDAGVPVNSLGKRSKSRENLA